MMEQVRSISGSDTQPFGALEKMVFLSVLSKSFVHFKDCEYNGTAKLAQVKFDFRCFSGHGLPLWFGWWLKEVVVKFFHMICHVFGYFVGGKEVGHDPF